MKIIEPQLNFIGIDCDVFLRDYWQKKPLVLKQAIPNFSNVISPEELAGLSLEPDIESRIVIQQPDQTIQWQLKNGPFNNQDYTDLPKTHWTLLIQGVDRLIPEVQSMLDYFNFIPQWRVDDVMISYAALYGSVGPHYDNYDVFLLQAQGKRKWMLTTQLCHEKNYLNNVDLRIMDTFIVEQEFTLEPGDILYLPPHVGHHGVSQSDDCMTYSFGYRSYQGLEMLNSYCDYLNEQDIAKTLYIDPDWREINQTSELSNAAWQNAKQLLLTTLSDDDTLKSWFGQFASTLDHTSETQLPPILEGAAVADFMALLNTNKTLNRNPICKIAYQLVAKNFGLELYINGVAWQVDEVNHELIKIIANHRTIDCNQLKIFLNTDTNVLFLFELWKLQWLQFTEEFLP